MYQKFHRNTPPKPEHKNPIQGEVCEVSVDSLSSSVFNQGKQDYSNPSNDILVPIKTNYGNSRFRSMAIVTAEIPKTQRTLEDGWNEFCMFQSPQITSETLLSSVGSSVLPGTSITLTAVDQTDNTAPIFTSATEHRLQNRVTRVTLETTSQPSLELVDANGNLNPNVTILSATTFQVSSQPASNWAPNTSGNPDEFGYVVESPIQSLQDLCSRISETWDNHTVTYFERTGEFQITGLKGQTVTIQSASLLTNLGFPIGTHSLPLTSKRANQPNLPGVICFSLRPGDYDASSLVQEVDRAISVGFQSQTETMTIDQNRIGLSENVLSVAGYQSHLDLIQTIQNATTGVTVQYSMSRFTLTASEHMTIDLTSNPIWASLLGMTETIHSGTTIVSDFDVQFYSHLSYSAQLQQGRLQIQSQPENLTGTMSQVGGQPLYQVTSTSQHGFQIGDLVRIRDGAGAWDYVAPVTSVQSSLVFRFRAGVQAPVITNPVSFSHYNQAIPLSTVISRSAAHNGDRQRLNQMLGFPANEDFIGSPTGTVAVVGDQYVLCQITEPSGMSSLTHIGAHNIMHENVVAKLLLSPVDDRMILTGQHNYIIFQQKSNVKRIRVRFINPDGQLYRMHGHKWSMTLRFQS